MSSSLLSRSLGQVKDQQRRTSTGSGAADPGTRSKPYSRPSEGGAWKHDMYSKSTPDSNSSTRSSTTNKPQGKSAKLQISNLHYEVSESELELLFQQTGPIVSGPKIKFDRSGRSEGIAWVTYGNEEHAAHAKEAFDGALAKGQEIKVEYDYRLYDQKTRGAAASGTLLARLAAEDYEARRGNARERSSVTSAPRSGRPERGIGRSGAYNSRGGRSGRGGNHADSAPRGGPRERREPREARASRGPKTQDDLDKELEAFMNQPDRTKNIDAPAASAPSLEAASTGTATNDVEMS